jgi:chromate reductase
MKKIITIGGSNSKKSINKVLAEYTGGLIDDVELLKVNLNDFDMPLFSIDIEDQLGIPSGAKELNTIIEQADGFVISLAEHNGSYSVAFKNAFDWLSRINGAVWRNKPMILLTAAPGERGGITMMNIALDRFPYLGAKIVGNMTFPLFNDNFKNGAIVNAELKSNLLKIVGEFEKAI